MERYTIYLFI